MAVYRDTFLLEIDMWTVRSWGADGPLLSRMSSNITIFGSVGGPK